MDNFFSKDFSTDQKRYELSPRNPNSLCNFNGKLLYWSKTYELKNSLPAVVAEVICKLRTSRLFWKCSHDKMLATNKSLNSLIWNGYPKSTFCEKNVSSIEVAIRHVTIVGCSFTTRNTLKILYSVASAWA